MNNALDTLQYAADLTKRLGAAPLPNGKTVREILSIDGVSIWDAVTPLLAGFLLTKELARKTPPTLFNRLLKPYLSSAKRRIKSLVPFPRSSNGCKCWPSEPVCLLLGFSGYMYRDVLEPIKRYFDGNHGMHCVALHDDGRFQKTAIQLHGEGIQSVWEHWDGRVRERELDSRRQLNAALTYLTAFRTLPDLIPGADGKAFKWLFNVHLPSLMPYLALTQHILKEHKTAIIVSPDVTDPRTRLFCLVGRSLDIPSLDVQFGLYNEDSVEWQFFVADKVAVWGEGARRLLTKTHGVPEDRISITGSPRFSGLASIDHVQIAATRSRLGIPDGRLMVLFASQYLLSNYSEFGDFPRIHRSVKKAIFEAADKVEGLILVVKPHPLENVQETKKLALGCRNVVFVERSDDIRELTKACDVFITLGSTATMDALVARKLVIFPSFPGLVWWDDMYLKNNVAVVVKSGEELARKLKEVVGDRSGKLLDQLEFARQRFLKEWIHQPDGQAAARIADLALQMAG